MRAKTALIATSQSETYEIATTAIRHKLFAIEGSRCTTLNTEVLTNEEWTYFSHLNDGVQESHSIEGGLPLRHVSHIQLVLSDSSVRSL